MFRHLKRSALALLVVASLLLPARIASAQWIPSGISTDHQTIVSDGAGGVIAVGSLGARRYNALGVMQWSASDIFPSNFYTLTFLASAPDGAGGALCVAALQPGGNQPRRIHINRITSAGEALWTGAQLADSTFETIAHVCSDGAGGAIAAWQDGSTGSSGFDIYAQKVNASGIPQWGDDGVPVCDLLGFQGVHRMIPYQGGGAILVWQDQRLGAIGGQDIYAQRVDAAGNPVWAANGIPVCNAAGVQEVPVIVSDGAGGAIIAWADLRTGDRDIYTQRLDSSGAPLWTANGVNLASGAIEQFVPEMISDGAQGAILTWEQGNGDIYAQRLNGAGAPLWMAGGVPICTAPNSQHLPLIVSDESGGAVIYWSDSRSAFPNFEAYLQRIDASGVPLWTADGVFVRESLTGSNTFPFPKGLVSDGLGGAYVGFPPNYVPPNSWSLRLHRVLPNGVLGWEPNFQVSWIGIIDEPSDQGGWVQLRVSRPLADGGVVTPAATLYNVWRQVPNEASSSSDGFHTAAARDVVARGMRERTRLEAGQAAAAGFPPGAWVSLGLHPATQSPTYTFAAPTHDDSTAAGPADDTYVIVTHTGNSALYVVSAPASGHSVDNLPPQMPQNLSGWQTGETSAQLTWSPSRHSDVAGYGVYKGASPDFVPADENRIGLPMSPGWTDAAFDPGSSHYKVCTFDRNGNHSGYALLTPTQITSAGPGGVPGVSYMARLVPNPARSGSDVTIEYGLARGGRVTLEILDPHGRVVHRLIDRDVEAGIQRPTWDGRDGAGSTVAPGAYWVRLVGPGIEKSARLIWLE